MKVKGPVVPASSNNLIICRHHIWTQERQRGTANTKCVVLCGMIRALSCATAANDSAGIDMTNCDCVNARNQQQTMQSDNKTPDRWFKCIRQSYSSVAQEFHVQVFLMLTSLTQTVSFVGDSAEQKKSISIGDVGGGVEGGDVKSSPQIALSSHPGSVGALAGC